MLPKGILFDLDDTIISFARGGILAWDEICDKYYKDCFLSNSDELLQIISQTSIWYWSDQERDKKGRNSIIESRREVIKIALEKIGITDQSLAHKISDSHSERREELIHVFPKAVETLDFLQKNNVLLALMTNGEAEYQRSKIERFNLSKFFEVILIEGEMGFGKPDKRVYHKALDSLRLSPSEVWAVGDNLEWEVWGPQQLGIHSIWNDYIKKGLSPSSEIVPHRIIHSIAELMN